MADSEEAAETDEHTEEMSIVDTLQSLLIAFILAFTFRGFVVEAFVIPTGSMAPTLLGAHALVHSPDTGYTFTVGPSQDDGGGGEPPPALATHRPYVLVDPMLASKRADELIVSKRRTRMGDRILVLKYLYSFFPPRRYDVVVFKNPSNPAENYIKRLIGLAGETVWLADGDVFACAGDATYERAGQFEVQRKPESVQRAVWQPIYHSDYIPIDPSRVRGGWVAPWSGEGWQVANRRSYRTDRATATAIAYDVQAHPINDSMPYNAPREIPNPVPVFDVSDIRLAAGLAPDADGLETTIHIECREHEFEAVVAGGKAELRMRPIGADRWIVLDSQPLPAFAPAGEVTDVEFWHADQALWLWVGGRRVAYGEYDWNPSERLTLATGLAPAEAAREPQRNAYYIDPEHRPRPARIQWRFDKSPLTLHRVELDRDLYYRPAEYGKNGRPALGTFPTNLVHLDSDQFFCCGDNSPESLDGRLWEGPEKWVAKQIDPEAGIVNRKMMLGKAFFVYFPSPEGLREGARRFVPSFGHMRFIH